MYRAIFLCVILIASAGSLGAQQASESEPYAGVSKPPANDVITDEEPAPPEPAAKPIAKPSPDHYAAPKPVEPAQAAPQEAAPANRVPPDFITSANSDGTDAGIVEPTPADVPSGQPGSASQPAAATHPAMARLYATDPDGDIVHPQPAAPGELGDGTIIRVRLLNHLASGINQPGDPFRGRVTQDVLQDGTVLIPAGSEIDGRVVRVSPGEGLGSSGSMDLRPDTVVLPDGTRFQMYAMVSSTPDSHTSVGAEGTVTPGSQVKRDSISYGAGIGTGAATGAIVGGPVGALAGSIVGAAAITVHLLTSHPQATLDSGSTVEFTLTQPLHLVPVPEKGN